MVDMRHDLLLTCHTLSPAQRSRPIRATDIIDAIVRFGTPLGNQITADYWSGFKAWDSFSMILQCEKLLPTRADVTRFKEWAMVRLSLEL